MSARGEALAAQFEAANREAIAFVAACPDSKWGSPCPNDGRTVRVVAHHIATGDVPIGDLVKTVANGGPMPPLTPQMIDEGNARHALQHANVSKEEVTQALTQNVAGPAAMVRALTDEQLDRKGSIFGNEWTAEQMIQNILIGHVTGHLESIRAAG